MGAGAGGTGPGADREAAGPPGLVTPEGVALQLSRAGPGTRILARGLDAVIQVVALIVFAVALGAAAGGLGTTALIVYLFAVPLIVFGYPAVMETAWRGRTLGKAAFGLRVVTVDGAPIRFRHALIRSLLFLIDGILLGATVGVLMLVITRGTVRLGDLAAGTIVIRERSGAGRPEPMAFPAPAGYEEYVRLLDAGRVSAADYELVRSVLLRAHEMTWPARWQIAAGVAEPLARKLGYARPPEMHPELFLACVAAACQMRGAVGASPPPWGGAAGGGGAGTAAGGAGTAAGQEGTVPSPPPGPFAPPG